MHQTKINMLTFSAYFMSSDRKGGVVSFSVDDKTLANSQMTDIPTLKLKRRCAILFNAAAKQFRFFALRFWPVCKIVIGCRFSPRQKKRIWLTFKHKRTSVASGGWSGAKRAFCGHNRPPASQITDRWGMQGEKAFTTGAEEKCVSNLFNQVMMTGTSLTPHLVQMSSFYDGRSERYASRMFLSSGT